MASIWDQSLYVDTAAQSDEWNDFDLFLEPSFVSGDVNTVSSDAMFPDMGFSYGADMLGHDLSGIMSPDLANTINYDVSHEGFLVDQFPDTGLMLDPVGALDSAMSPSYRPYDGSIDFRQIVEAQAAADTRLASIKEKRREAAIALHLQRLCDATALDLETSSDSTTSFSSPSWSDYVRESISPQPTTSSPKGTPIPAPAAGNGALELVLDLNMNATTNLPRKQKPRSQAQKENYIKTRKYGACEKHKKQHKRCNCMEKTNSRAGVNEVLNDIVSSTKPDTSTYQCSALPDSRSAGLPGHDSSQNRPVNGPLTKKTTQSVKTAPGHDRSSSPVAAQPLVTPTIKTARIQRGHVPHYSISAVLPVVKEAKVDVGSSAGHDLSSSHSSTTPKSVRTGLPGTGRSIYQPAWRWCSMGFSAAEKGRSNTLAHVAPETSINTRRVSRATMSNTGSLHASNLQIQRPQAAVSSSLVHGVLLPTRATSHQTLYRGELREAKNLELIASRRNLNKFRTLEQELALRQSLRESYSDGQCLVSVGDGVADVSRRLGYVVRSFTAQLSEVLSYSVLAVAGAMQLSRPLGLLSGQLIRRSLFFAGKHLMGVKKGLHLSHMRLSFSTF